MPVLNPDYTASSGGTGNITSDEVTAIEALNKAEYEAIPNKDAKTLYLIKG